MVAEDQDPRGDMLALITDLKLVIRHLLRSPSFTLAAILMLAVGVGATTSIFSIVEGVLLRPLPFPQPDRLVVISEIRAGQVDDADDAKITGPDILAYLHGTHSFENLGGYKSASYEFSGWGDSVDIKAARLGAGVFPALGVAPLLGRTFTQQEDDTQQPVAVLSYALWQRSLHGDPQVLGSKILLDRKPYVVIGVMPRNFEFPLLPGHVNNSELWVPLSLTHAELYGAARAFFDFWMVGRLRPGVSFGEAQEDTQHVLEQTMRGYPPFMRGFRFQALLRSLKEGTISQAKPLVYTLFLAVTVVLLIATANLAGLLLVRAVRRRHEIAVRLALGARVIVLARQSVLESLTLSFSGGVLGLLGAATVLRVGVRLLPETLPRINEISLDWKVVCFASLLVFVTGSLCGLAPVVVALRTRVSDALKDGGRTSSIGSGHARLRSILVVCEIAVALVLVTSAGLLLRSFERMREANLGFHPHHIVVAAYSLPRKQYVKQSLVDAFNRELLQRLQQMPGVRAVGLTSVLPQTGVDQSIVVYQVKGVAASKDGGLHYASAPVVSGNYFQAMGIPLLRGRFFTEADDARSQPVAIVNHKVAELYWPGQSPVGKYIHWGFPETQTPWVTIVGEVADVKQGSPDQEVSEQIYQPLHQRAISYGSFALSLSFEGESGYIVLRSALRPEEAEKELRDAVGSIDKQLPLSQVETMDRALYDGEAPRRFNTTLISALAAAAVLLAMLGIYSVIAFATAMRMQEMAIRVALGSPRSGIVRLTLISAAKLSLAGCALGLVGAVAATRLLQSFLFDVSPFDPLVMVLSAIVVLCLALAASLVPAQRAASIEPVAALRSE